MCGGGVVEVQQRPVLTPLTTFVPMGPSASWTNWCPVCSGHLITGSVSPSCDAVALSLIPLSAPSGPLSLSLVFSVVPVVPCFLSAGHARNSKGFVSERCSLTLNGTHSFSFSVSAHTFTHIYNYNPPHIDTHWPTRKHTLKVMYIVCYVKWTIMQHNSLVTAEAECDVSKTLLNRMVAKLNKPLIPFYFLRNFVCYISYISSEYISHCGLSPLPLRRQATSDFNCQVWLQWWWQMKCYCSVDPM